MLSNLIGWRNLLMILSLCGLLVSYQNAYAALDKYDQNFVASCDKNRFSEKQCICIANKTKGKISQQAYQENTQLLHQMKQEKNVKKSMAMMKNIDREFLTAIESAESLCPTEKAANDSTGKKQCKNPDYQNASTNLDKHVLCSQQCACEMRRCGMSSKCFMKDVGCKKSCRARFDN